MPEPRLLVLEPEAYWALAEAGRLAGGGLPWWWRFAKALGRPGAWYVSRFAGGGPTVVVLLGRELDARLMAHEYGHHLGHEHPPVLSLDFLLDIMGYGLRVRDRHGLLEASAEWRRRRGLR